MALQREITLRFLAEPTDVNFGGKVHGGAVMRWIDWAGFACALGWSGLYCVTAYVGGIAFENPISIGDLVEVRARVMMTGRSSLHVGIEVTARDPRGDAVRRTTHCMMVFVDMADGKPVPVPAFVPFTVQVGLKRSSLVSEELDRAQEGNILCRTTLSLFYATDFADQMENIILPALRAGQMVLADRYIYTLIARDIVRGMNEVWLKNLYGMALVPDAVFYLNVAPEELVQRTFAKYAALDYWESGMDIGLSRDIFDSFLKYQALMAQQFKRLQRTYAFDIIDGHRPVETINAELRGARWKLY